MEVFDNFAVAPLDAPPDWEGDDTVPVTSRQLMPTMMLGAAEAAVAASLVVPYRYAEPGDIGDQVHFVKRLHARFRGNGRLAALWAKPDSVKRTWSKYTGPGSFYRDFKETRRLLGLTGPVVYDEAAWRKLAKYADSFALSLIAPAPPQQTQTQKQLAWHMALYNRRYQVAYSQYRPSQLGRPEEIKRADCSGSVAAGCKWANILPQVDWRWTNTRVQINFGTPVSSVGMARLGDIVFYGSGGDPGHEAMYLGSNRIWSFGSYPIKLLPIDYRTDRMAIRRFIP